MYMYLYKVYVPLQFILFTDIHIFYLVLLIINVTMLLHVDFHPISIKIMNPY